MTTAWHSRLQASGAPDKLLVWVKGCSPKDAWNGCDKASWLIWMAACSRLPVDELLHVGLACVDRAVARLDGGIATQLRAALDDVAGLDAAACKRAVTTCQAVVKAAAANYRTAVTTNCIAAAKGATWIAKASEGFATARAHDEASRTQSALQRASAHGVPPAMMMAPAGDLIWLPHAMAQAPLHDELGFVVHAIARSVHYAGRATVRPQGTHQEHEEAEVALADLVHAALTPRVPAFATEAAGT